MPHKLRYVVLLFSGVGMLSFFTELSAINQRSVMRHKLLCITISLLHALVSFYVRKVADSNLECDVLLTN